MPPCTTKRRTTTNLKTKNNPNCQKIELCPTAKELKKKHSSRPVGGVETCSLEEKIYGKVADGGPGQGRQWLVAGRSHICVRINWEKELGARQTA